MKRKILFLSGLMLFSNYLFCQLTISAIFNKTKTAIFKIEILNDKDDIIKIGTGFFISENGIGVSNFHVFEGAKKARIVTYNGKLYNIIKTISWEANKDLIIFKVSNPKNTKFNFLKKEKNQISIGEKVIVIGNPKGLEYSLSDGIVSSLRKDEKMGEIIQTTVPISSGNSGSPLINMNNNYIGIISFSLKDAQNLNFAIHSNQLEKLVPVNQYLFPKQHKQDVNENEISDARANHLYVCDFWKNIIEIEKKTGKREPIQKNYNSKNIDNFNRIPSTISTHDSKSWLVTTLASVELNNLTSVITLGINNEYNTNTKVNIQYSYVANGRVTHVVDDYFDVIPITTDDNSKLDLAEVPITIFDSKLILKVYIYENYYITKYSYSNLKNEFEDIYGVDKYRF